MVLLYVNVVFGMYRELIGQLLLDTVMANRLKKSNEDDNEVRTLYVCCGGVQYNSVF